MGRRRRRRVDPTDDWEQLELLCLGGAEGVREDQAARALRRAGPRAGRANQGLGEDPIPEDRGLLGERHAEPLRRGTGKEARPARLAESSHRGPQGRAPGTQSLGVATLILLSSGSLISIFCAHGTPSTSATTTIKALRLTTTPAHRETTIAPAFGEQLRELL